jgi:hypothetical protein
MLLLEKFAAVSSPRNFLLTLPESSLPLSEKGRTLEVVDRYSKLSNIGL